MKRYRVLLPVEIDGQIYHYGQEVELDVETAKGYSHALMALGEEATSDGGNS